MTDDWREGYRRAVGEFLMKNGVFVEDRYYGKRDWSGERDPSDYDEYNVTFGWADYSHLLGHPHHDPPIPACHPVSVDTSTMRERSLSQFVDTSSDNRDEVGVEVRATCACGKYENKWLRWTGSVGEILPALLEQD